MLKRFIIAMFAVCALLGVTAYAEPADGFELIIERKKAEAVGGDHDLNDENVMLVVKNREQQGRNAWNTMIKDPNRTLLWEGELLDKYTTGSGIHNSFSKLAQMTVAYGMKGSELYHNEQLRDDIISGLDFLNRTIYFEGDKYSRTGQLNWFYWEISIPQAITQMLCILYDEVDEDLRNRLVAACLNYAPKAMYGGIATTELVTGSNVIWKCSNHILMGALTKNPKLIEEGKAGIDTTFVYVDEVEEQEGYRTDGSQTMHPMFPYAGGYGKDGYSNTVNLFSLLDGTEFAFGQEQSDMLYEWTFNTYVPHVYKCAFFDGSRGRYVAREGTSGIISGIDVLRTLFRLSVNAPEDKKKMLWGIIKQNLAASDEFKKSFMKSMGVDIATEAAKMLADDSIPATPYGQEARFYAGMNVAFYRTEKFMFAMRMFSDRIGSYESINDENLHGWYQGHGATYIYNNDLKHYSDNYWPTVDPYKLAGTTVSDVERPDSYRTGYYSTKKWSGGVTLDNEFAAVGMDFEDYKTELDSNILNAKKSWFLIDDQIIALGCGVTNKNPTADNNTYVENRSISENDKIYADGVEYGYGDTVSGDFDYIYYEGEKDSIGYCFPGREKINLTSLECSGAWVDIRSSDGRADIITKKYMQISSPHGVMPEGDTYEYVLLPGKTHSEVAEYAANPSTVVLENTPTATAVRNDAKKVTCVNFWTDSKYSVGGITSYGKSCVAMREKDGELHIAISDPTQLQEELVIEIDKQVSDAVYVDEDVEVVSTYPVLRLKLNVYESLGYTFNCIFKLKNEELQVKPPYSMRDKSIVALREGTAACYLKGEIKDLGMPVYHNGSLMASIHFFSEALGGDMVYDTENNCVRVKTIYGEGVFSLGGGESVINGNKINISAAMNNGTVYLPLRLVAEGLYQKGVFYENGLVTLTQQGENTNEAISEYLSIVLG